MTETRHWTPEHVPTYSALTGLLEKFLPGKSEAVCRLREECARACANPLINNILLLGNVGIGKSFLANLIALGKEFVGMDTEIAARTVGALRLDHSGRPRWADEGYRELTVTGLSPQLLESELFGHLKGAFTDAAENKKGVFQAAKEAGSDLSEITGGVVFLDEIVDLPKDLQGKLLAPCGRTAFYRVGDAGGENIDYQGVIITATWNEEALRNPAIFRRDLLTRIEGCTIRIPGLCERMEDFDRIVEGLIDNLRGRWRQKREALDRMLAARYQQTGVGQKVAKYWAELGANPLRKNKPEGVELKRISREEQDQLRSVDWSRCGELRGLAGALEALVINGDHVKEVASWLRTNRQVAPSDHSEHRRSLFSRLLESDIEAQTLLEAVKQLELQDRAQLRQDLADQNSRRRLSSTLRIEERKIADQVRRLKRRGRTGE